MIKHESKFGLTFRAWWRANRMKGVFELKDSRGKDYIPVLEITMDQVNSAKANESKRGNLVRVQSGTAGTGDYIALVEYPSYLVAKFPGNFYIIRMKKFAKKCYKVARLSEPMAYEMADVVVKTIK